MRSRRSRRSPVAWIAAAAFALAGLLAAAQIVIVGIADAASSRRVGLLAEWRPGNARGLSHAAAEALAAGGKDRAGGLALKAVRQAPFEVAAIRTLGQVRNAERPGSGDDLMVLAGRLGWRDRPTQLWTLERAVAAGAFGIAIQRAEAMVRTQQEPNLAFTMLRLMVLEPGSRRDLVEALAARPLWRLRFFYAGINEGTDQQLRSMATLLSDLRHTAGPPTLTEARATIDALATRGEVATAYRLYREIGGISAADAPSRNADFETDIGYHGGRSGTLFDWRILEASGAVAGVEARAEEGGNKLVYVTSDEAARGTVLTRLFVLPPGAYELSYRIRSAQADAPAGVQLVMVCDGGGGPLFPPSAQPLQGDGWQRRSVRFTVGSGCAAQRLELRVTGTPAVEEIMFDDVLVAAPR